MTHDEQALLQKLRALAGNQILEIGEIPSAALSAWPARVTNRVIITAERRQHYLFRHPEVVELEALIVTTLLDPVEVHRFAPDKAVANLYRPVNDRNDLMVSVWISHDPDKQNSVHSARIQHHRRLETSRDRGNELWRK